MKKLFLFSLFVAITATTFGQSFFKADTLAIKIAKKADNIYQCGTTELEDAYANWDFHTMEMVKKASNLQEAITALSWARVHPDNPVFYSSLSKAKSLAYQKVAQAKTSSEVDDLVKKTDFWLHLKKDSSVMATRERLWLAEQEKAIDARN